MAPRKDCPRAIFQASSRTNTDLFGSAPPGPLHALMVTTLRFFGLDPDDPMGSPGSDVNSLLSASDGRIYIGMSGSGLWRFDYDLGHFQRLDSTPEAQSLISGDVSDVREMENGQIFLNVEDKEFVVYDPQEDQWQHIYDKDLFPEHASNFFRSIKPFSASDGAIYFGISGFGLHAYDPLTQSATIRCPLKKREWLNLWERSKIRDYTDIFAFPAAGDSVAIRLRSNLLVANCKEQKEVVSIVVEDLELYYPFTDRDKRIWFIQDRILRYWDPFSAKNNEIVIPQFEPARKDIRISWQSPDGRLWANDGFRLIHFQPDQFFYSVSNTKPSPLQLSPTSLRSIKADPFDPELYWIPGYDGVDLYHVNKGRVNLKGEVSGQPIADFHPYHALRISQDTLLMCGETNGILIYDLRTKKLTAPWDRVTSGLKPGDSGYGIYALTELEDGSVWFAANQGLYSFKPASGEWKYEMDHINEGQLQGRNWVIDSDPKGRVWAGGANGVIWLDRSKGMSGNSTILEQIPVPVKSMLFRDNGELWLGTSGDGIMIVDPEEIIEHSVDKDMEVISVKDGLPDNVVYGMLEDKEKNVWISTNKGLARISGEERNVLRFSIHDGLQESEFNTVSYLKDARGRMFFGGINGLTWLDPDSLQLPDPNYKVMLTGVDVFGEEQRIGKDLNKKESLLVLQPEQSVFSVRFALSDYANPEANSFEYKIDGKHDEWMKMGKEPLLTFRDLSPGDHNLLIKGKDHWGRVQPELFRMSIKVIPFWYQTTWFRVGLSIAVMALIAFAFGYRIQRIRKQNELLELQVDLRTKEIQQQKEEIALALKERESLLKEIHHRVKNNLQVISSLLSLQIHATHDEELADAMRDARNRIHSMALIHQRLYQSELLSEVNFANYVQDLAVGMNYAYNQPGSEIEVKLNLQDIFLEIEEAVPLGLIVNELLSNSLKYAFPDEKKGTIEVNLEPVKKDWWQLSVKDDGVGLPGDFDLRKEKSMGMTLIHDLARQIDGNIEMKNGKGLTVMVNFPKLKQ